MTRARKIFVLGWLAFVLVLIFWALYQKESQGPEVVFLDAGQGDAALIRLPGDVQILIDGGPSGEVASKLGRYFPFYDKDIELVVLTHPHADHLRGLIEVFKDYNVKNFMWSSANYESRVYSEFVEALKSEGGNVYLAKAGDAVKHQGTSLLRILSPLEFSFGQSFKKIHDSNIVSQLDIGRKKFLLMGDAEEPMEKDLLAAGAIEDIDVLKVGHHGSKTSTSADLLNAANPEEAVIPVGRNSYGHPHRVVLDRLAKFGTMIFRTDEAGDVVYK